MNRLQYCCAGLRILAVAGVLTFGGCMTVASQVAYIAGKSPDNMIDPEAVLYGGTRIHCGALSDGAFDGAAWSAAPFTQSLTLLFVVVDLPLSFVGDTLVLPITLIEHAAL